MIKNKFGTLYVVATPIGNLKDMTERAVEVLREVACIAAEDTRHSAPLLKHFAIEKPTISLHNFNERERVERILTSLQEGQSVALISDAGTPLISDPGFVLVRQAREAGITVSPLPGACAAIAALSVSGLPTDSFMFEGFLPPKTESRKNQLRLLQSETRTTVFYEAPHRLLDTLKDMCEVFGDDRKAVVARELSKLYESVISDSLSNLVEYYVLHHDECRGEIVLIVAGATVDDDAPVLLKPQAVLKVLLQELPVKQAVALACDITGAKRNQLYELALQLKK